MSYIHIKNLYKDQRILMFKECYAMEKINGTSAHITYNASSTRPLSFCSGCTNYINFVSLFDTVSLSAVLSTFKSPVIIYGESYGGKLKGSVYGKDMKFIVFEVKVGELYLSVPDAESVAKSLNLEFVSYNKIPATIEAINSERDAESVQAVRNGMGHGLKREGVVLRPLVELRLNNDDRIICKHKNDDERETKTPRELTQTELTVLENSNAIAEEWVTTTRLMHVLDKVSMPASMKDMPTVINLMIEDVNREGVGEFVDSKETKHAISKKTVELFKEYLKN